jgi:hypothetical protein
MSLHSFPGSPVFQKSHRKTLDIFMLSREMTIGVRAKLTSTRAITNHCKECRHITHHGDPSRPFVGLASPIYSLQQLQWLLSYSWLNCSKENSERVRRWQPTKPSIRLSKIVMDHIIVCFIDITDTLVGSPECRTHASGSSI